MDIVPIGNSYSTSYLVVSGGSAMLVDAATSNIASKVLDALSRAQATLNLIVLTHYHYDHVGAADPLRQATGAPVAIHQLDAEPLRRGGPLQVTPTRLQGRILAPFVTRGDKPPVNPDLELGDEEDLQRYGGFGQSFWTPGHTPGSISVLLPDGTVLAGDALTEAILPPHSARGPIFTEDVEASRRSITRIADKATRGVLVAHRGHLDLASLERLAQRSR